MISIRLYQKTMNQPSQLDHVLIMYNQTIRQTQSNNYQNQQNNDCPRTPLIKQYSTNPPTVRKASFRSRLRCQIKVQYKQENKTKTEERNLILVNPSYSKKCVNKSWPLFFKIVRQIFSTTAQTT